MSPPNIAITPIHPTSTFTHWHPSFIFAFPDSHKQEDRIGKKKKEKDFWEIVINNMGRGKENNMNKTKKEKMRNKDRKEGK